VLALRRISIQTSVGRFQVSQLRSFWKALLAQIEEESLNIPTRYQKATTRASICQMECITFVIVEVAGPAPLSCLVGMCSSIALGRLIIARIVNHQSFVQCSSEG
jgi:hypothetical protein